MTPITKNEILKLNIGDVFTQEKSDLLMEWAKKFKEDILEAKIKAIEREKRTDETQMSEDHTFDEALDLAISILRE